MIKLVIISKYGINVLLNLFAGVVLLVSYIIPIYKYEWTENPELSKITNPDSVLVVLLMLVVILMSGITP
jgi:hypothetical protein